MKLEARLPQGTIRYREEGSGETLIFLNGLFMNGLMWRDVVPRLSGEARCIVPDWPLGAHEVPMTADADFSLPGLARMLVDFMDALGVERATLVGNDSGGAIAQQVAVDHPERVDRLVLNSCELFERFLPPLFKGLQVGARLPGTLWLVAQLLRFRTVQRLPNAYGWSMKQGLPAPEVMEAYVRPARVSAGVRRDLRRFLLAVDPRYTLEAAERLKSFGKPVLVVWAAEDKLFPLDYPRRFAAGLPDARLELIANSYTFVPEDQPAALAEAIARFVREGRPAAATA